MSYDLAALLERAGGKLRGRNRADCPKCKRFRSVAFDDSRGVYHCHRIGCGFSGSKRKLERELGVYRRLPPAEYRELCQRRDRENDLAQALAERVKARRMELLDWLHDLNQIEVAAHMIGADSPAAWDGLGLVDDARPSLMTELTILEDAPMPDVVRFLGADAETRRQMLGLVLVYGGLYDAEGKFMEVHQ